MATALIQIQPKVSSSLQIPAKGYIYPVTDLTVTDLAPVGTTVLRINIPTNCTFKTGSFQFGTDSGFATGTTINPGKTPEVINGKLEVSFNNDAIAITTDYYLTYDVTPQ